MNALVGKTVTLRTLGKKTWVYLSARKAPDVNMDTFATDDASGRQRFVVLDAGAGCVFLKLARRGREWFLSTVDSRVEIRSDADPTVQTWEPVPLAEGVFAFKAGGKFLSAHDDSWNNDVDLWGEIGPEGRQSWKVECIPSAAPAPSAAAPTAQAQPQAQPQAGRMLTIDPALTLPGWKAASKRTRVSYDNGGIRVTYPAHPHASAGGTNFSFKPDGLFPAREARLSCDVFIPADFPFEASGSSAGKFGLGLEVGKGTASGGNWSQTGASFRPMWLGADREGADAMGYIYVEVANPSDHRSSLDQAPGVLDSAVLTNGGVNLWRKLPKPCRLVKGRWNSVEIHMRLNTPGKRDGLAEMIVNGQRQVAENFRWLLPGSTSLIETCWFATWFGGSGSDPSWAPGRECWSTTKNVRVWTDRA